MQSTLPDRMAGKSVFAALAEAPLTADAVAAKIACPARSTGILLDALAVVGLATRHGVRMDAGRNFANGIFACFSL